MTRHVAVTTLDDVVRMAIEDLYPDQTIPDEHNYLPDGTQFKAPDHSIMGGAVLIERKSGNPVVTGSRYYKKMAEIAREQGKPFYAVGRFDMGQVIRSLPDPDLANRKLIDYMLNQTLKRIRQARRKFEEYAQHVNINDAACVLVYSDNSNLKASTAAYEYFLGKKMGGTKDEEDQTGRIDAICFVKDPRYVLRGPESYWFKCILKNNVSGERVKNVSAFVGALHHRIAHYADYHSSALADADRFRMLRV